MNEEKREKMKIRSLLPDEEKMALYIREATNNQLKIALNIMHEQKFLGSNRAVVRFVLNSIVSSREKRNIILNFIIDQKHDMMHFSRFIKEMADNHEIQTKQLNNIIRWTVATENPVLPLICDSYLKCLDETQQSLIDFQLKKNLESLIAVMKKTAAKLENVSSDRK